MLLANIKGQHRHRKVLELIREGRLDALKEWLISEKLSPELRDLTGRIHPMLMGGEYLPDCDQGQVEIARVSLGARLSNSPIVAADCSRSGV